MSHKSIVGGGGEHYALRDLLLMTVRKLEGDCEGSEVVRGTEDTSQSTTIKSGGKVKIRGIEMFKAKRAKP